jgi:hypothetical protein
MDKQHPETAAARLTEGGNSVDEALRLAPVSREANLAQIERRRVLGKMVERQTRQVYSLQHVPLTPHFRRSSFAENGRA